MTNTLYYGDNLPILRHLVGTVEREQAAIGLFLTLEKPTSDMLAEAAAAGFYDSPGFNRKYPRIQILWINDLLHNVARAEHPPTNVTFKQAGRIQDAGAHQPGLGIEE